MPFQRGAWPDVRAGAALEWHKALPRGRTGCRTGWCIRVKPWTAELPTTTGRPMKNAIGHRFTAGTY